MRHTFTPHPLPCEQSNRPPPRLCAQPSTPPHPCAVLCTISHLNTHRHTQPKVILLIHIHTTSGPTLNPANNRTALLPVHAHKLPPHPLFMQTTSYLNTHRHTQPNVILLIHMNYAHNLRPHPQPCE